MRKESFKVLTLAGDAIFGYKIVFDYDNNYRNFLNSVKPSKTANKVLTKINKTYPCNKKRP